MERLRLGGHSRAPPPFRGWPDTELRNQIVAGWGPAGFGSLSRGRGTLQHQALVAGALLGGSPCVMGERPRSDRAVGPGYGSPGLAAFGVAGAVRFACARGWQHAVGPTNGLQTGCGLTAQGTMRRRASSHSWHVPGTSEHTQCQIRTQSVIVNHQSVNRVTIVRHYDPISEPEPLSRPWF